MEKQKTKAQGLILYSEWRQGSLRGHRHIGDKIIKDYNITEEDLAIRTRRLRASYKRYYRAKKKSELEKNKKEEIQYAKNKHKS